MVPVSATEGGFKTKANHKQLFAELFFKIGVLKNFVIFTRKCLCWSLILVKLQA